MNHAIHICSFQSADTVTRRTTYGDLKAAVLKAGRFSVFEATANDRAAGMFDRLERDPDIETDHTCGFPWIGVKIRVRPSDTKVTGG